MHAECSPSLTMCSRHDTQHMRPGIHRFARPTTVYGGPASNTGGWHSIGWQLNQVGCWATDMCNNTTALPTPPAQQPLRQEQQLGGHSPLKLTLTPASTSHLATQPASQLVTGTKDWAPTERQQAHNQQTETDRDTHRAKKDPPRGPPSCEKRLHRLGKERATACQMLVTFW